MTLMHIETRTESFCADAGCSKPTYFNDISGRKLGSFDLFAARYSFGTDRRPMARPMIVTALGRAVVPVVFGCTEKQMVRANAAGIIAMMANVHPLGDMSIDENPSIAMGRFRVSVDKEAAIASRIMGTLPYPTSFRLHDGSPKTVSACNDRFLTGQLPASAATKTAGPRRITLDSETALFADNEFRHRPHHNINEGACNA